MRRKPGAILPIEESVLAIAMELNRTGGRTFHGFEMAKLLADGSDASRLTAHGTLYKALSRMEKAGLLESRWEDPQLAADDGRPRRRLYRITGAGEAVWSKLEAERLARHNKPNLGLAPS